MRVLFTIAFVLLVFISCNNPSEQNNSAKKENIDKQLNVDLHLPDSVTQFLLFSCASDFHKQDQSSAVEFRNSYLGYKQQSSAGERLFLLCGEFRSKKQEKWSEWIPYATIQTSGYEQLVGGQALGFCRDSAIIKDLTNDVSLSLKLKFDSLNN